LIEVLPMGLIFGMDLSLKVESAVILTSNDKDYF
jgi:hypothetical protein